MAKSKRVRVKLKKQQNTAKVATKATFYRNPVAAHPMLKKGGVHEKTNGAKRKHNKQQLKAAIKKERVYRETDIPSFAFCPSALIAA